MTHRAPLSAGLAVLALAAAIRLEAQAYRTFREEADAIRETARLRVGPLRLQPLFRLSEAGYDSNVYFRPEGGGAEAVGDVTATLAPEVRAHWLVGSSLILTATESPEYLFYAREKGQRAFSNNFSGGLRAFLLGRLSLAADYHAYSHVRRGTSELDRRLRDTRTGGAARLFFETARGTAFGAAAAVDDIRFEDVAAGGGAGDPYARALDRRETSAAAELHYRVFTRSSLFAAAGWTRYAFADPASAWRDAEAIEVRGGFRFPLTGRARGAVIAGWKSFRPDSPERRPFSGLVAASEVYVRLGRVAVTVGYDRDSAFSYNETAYYYVDGRGRAALSLYLAPFLRLDGGVQYGTMAYPEAQTVWTEGGPVLVARREDVQRTFSAGPVVRLAGSVGLGLTYNFYKRTSNAPGFDVRRNFAGAFLTYEF